MLGFATVDLFPPDATLTMWLTSVQRTAHAPHTNHAAHTNALTFGLDDETTPRLALGMLCDRYVVLTDRTPRDHPLLTRWAVESCDLGMLAEQTRLEQDVIMAAFTRHSAKPGKADLMEPYLPPVPSPVDQTAFDTFNAGTALTLAVANYVMKVWETWLATERERVKRWTYMPGGRKGEKPALLPSEFTQKNTLQPIRLVSP